jgi:putative colanic acid biosynthesis acetyltransferase WcaF
MMPERKGLRTLAQADAYSSPWPLGLRLKMLLWEAVWLLLFRPTPKPLYRWRVWLLRLFGCQVQGRPFVAASAIVKMPWNLVLEDRACLGAHSEVFNLARVTLRARCTVAQEVYLCTGSHDFSQPELPLVVGTITIGADAFLGARAFVMPGVEVGTGAVVAACAVVTQDVPPWSIVAGNPARPIGSRHFARSPAEASSPLEPIDPAAGAGTAQPLRANRIQPEKTLP